MRILIILSISLTCCKKGKYKDTDGEPIFALYSKTETARQLQNKTITIKEASSSICSYSTDFDSENAQINHLYKGNFRNRFLKNLGLISFNKLKIKNSANFATSPIVCNDRLYNIDSSGIIKSYIINKGNVKEIWSYKINKGDLKSFLLANARVDKKTIFINSNNGNCIALNAENGKEIWYKNYKSGFYSSFASDESQLYIIGSNNIIMAINKTNGEINWKFQAKESKTTSLDNAPILIHKDYIIAATSAGEILAIKKNGDFKWNYTIFSNKVSGSIVEISDIDFLPAIVNNTLIVGGIKSAIFGIDVDNGRPIWSLESALRSNIIHNDKDFFFFVNDQQDIIAASVETGQIKWTLGLQAFYKKNVPSYLNDGKRIMVKNINRHYPMFINGKIFIIDNLGNLQEINPDNGDLDATHHVTYAVSSMPIVQQNAIYLLDEFNNLYVLD
jgi:outer membrane protein assembly factor BamB